MSRFLVDPTDNIFNYYLLPIVGVNKASFDKYFIRTLVNKIGTLVYVKVNSSIIVKSIYFKGLQDIENQYYCVYTVPNELVPDVKLIIKGEYSKISEKVKTIIKDNSGLVKGKFVKSIETIYVSKAILALDRHPALIMDIKNELGLTTEQLNEYLIIPKRELVDKPRSFDFIEFYLE